MKKLIKTGAIIAGGLAVLVISGSVYFTLTYPKDVPVVNFKVVATPERVERGKYLANNVAVCLDCHSTRDFTKFSGPV